MFFYYNETYAKDPPSCSLFEDDEVSSNQSDSADSIKAKGYHNMFPKLVVSKIVDEHSERSYQVEGMILFYSIKKSSLKWTCFRYSHQGVLAVGGIRPSDRAESLQAVLFENVELVQTKNESQIVIGNNISSRLFTRKIQLKSVKTHHIFHKSRFVVSTLYWQAIWAHATAKFSITGSLFLVLNSPQQQ